MKNASKQAKKPSNKSKCPQCGDVCERQRCPYCQLNNIDQKWESKKYPKMTKIVFVAHQVKKHGLDIKGATKLWEDRAPAWME